MRSIHYYYYSLAFVQDLMLFHTKKPHFSSEMIAGNLQLSINCFELSAELAEQILTFTPPDRAPRVCCLTYMYITS